MEETTRRDPAAESRRVAEVLWRGAVERAGSRRYCREQALRELTAAEDWDRPASTHAQLATAWALLAQTAPED